MEPETAWRVALTERTANPVAQMGRPEVFERFSARDLDAIQWDSLEEDVSRCADYDLVPDHAARLPAPAQRGPEPHLHHAHDALHDNICILRHHHDRSDPT